LTANTPNHSPLSDEERAFAHLIAELTQVMLEADGHITEIEMDMGRINGLHVATHIGECIDGTDYPSSRDPIVLAIFAYALTTETAQPSEKAITAAQERLLAREIRSAQMGK
jgi:hypothetical protein